MSASPITEETVVLAGREVRLYSLSRLAALAGVEISAIPFSGRVLIETALRAGDTETALAVARCLADGQDADGEVRFRPARVLMQDYTAIPLLVDMAAIRDTAQVRGGAPQQVNPAVPTEVVVDHSVQADFAGIPEAQARNEALELERNAERYAFLKWAAQAFDNLRVIPPGNGIVHQVNLEALASVVALREEAGALVAFPDTVVGTDSHTTMVNGLGVLGWGVGGLEAQAVMLGLAHPMRFPRIVGVRLEGALRPGVTATDVVLTLTHFLRANDVGGAIVEFTGPGVEVLSAPDRCTLANMAPEYGAMGGFFPVDTETLRYLRQTGRSEEAVRFVEAYCRAQNLLRVADAPEPRFSRLLPFDLAQVEASLAGPSQPHQRVSLGRLSESFQTFLSEGRPEEKQGFLRHGDIVIASITSCTNTSNPRAMLAAGLLARNAVERGLTVPMHVKTSLSPGSRAVTRYLKASGLLSCLEALGFYVAGYGCMTCNGGSGPLAPDIAEAIERDNLTVCAALSGNRNFEGRVHPQVRAGYLASPALVVALALTGHVRGNLDTDPIGFGNDGKPVTLADIWPDDAEIAEIEARVVVRDVFRMEAADAAGWSAIAAERGPVYSWSEQSTYVRRPPYIDARSRLGTETEIRGARALVALGDYVSTDHISPVGQVAPESPAGVYLRERGVAERSLNSYGSRRGNYEVMARGTFANERLRNRLLPGVEGGTTLHIPSGERLTVFEAAERYAAEGTPLLILAGKSYGTGSSRDWAAKGPWLLGVRAILAESFERIHRANLCAMSILPLTFPSGQSWETLGLDGQEVFDLDGLDSMVSTGQVQVRARKPSGREIVFSAQVEVVSRGEWEVVLEGGMLPYLLKRLAE